MSDNETLEQLKQRKLSEIEQLGEQLLAPSLRAAEQLRGMGRIEGRLYELKEAGLLTWEETQKIENLLAYKLGWRGGEW